MRCLKKPILLFETIKVENGVALNLDFHEARAISACGGLKFSIREMLKKECESLKSSQIYRAKLVYNEFGEFAKCEIYPYVAREFKTFKLVEVDFKYEKKFLDRDLINHAFQKRDGCDEILMLKDGFATDTSIANIAIFDGFNWLSPKKPLLQGTTRARLLENGFLKFADINRDMLLSTKKFAILNAMVGFKKIDKFEFIV
ncbi:aminotransferase class IV [Campylobacter geochelonis]|uniref:aminotransferase class IV n=1 Tax=Campylobacter geochelonis TaxID=1780362 RepID=UPI000770B304|nr:aminotransferase class IV [Campylobacter geochelonis]CZE49368.1 putative chorismate binding enzyme [Campylobacter geochelonis]CZE51454.1 putative chorismate binding enzyme [Campylobacter geochelonis]